jgi:hypothetical protein
MYIIGSLTVGSGTSSLTITPGLKAGISTSKKFNVKHPEVKHIIFGIV